MRFQSLADFISAAASKKNEVGYFKSVNRDLEIGVLTELMAEQQGPLLVFDHFENFPPGFRVASNVLNKPSRFALAMGLPADLHPIDLLKHWREKIRHLEYINPVFVPSGRIYENVMVEKEVDLSIFPAPKWHEDDGGRYIGTGDFVVVRDPDTGWINLGTYRCCIQGKAQVSLWIIKAKHGRMIAEKYWNRGEACPVAIVIGADPVTWTAAVSSQPAGVSEYTYAGALHGAPVELVETPLWHLPVPAGAEIVLEGSIPNPENRSVSEGPFGEWPGYYAHKGQETVVDIKSVLYANDPIILGSPPLLPTGTNRGVPVFACALWDHMERSGITDIQGIWGFCNTLMIVISLKQRYAGHAKQALLAASGYRASSSMYRYYVVVDEDIDPSNLDEVLWALCTRVDPAESIEVIRDVWTSQLDPRLSPEKQESGNFTMGRLLIDACKPYHWFGRFPQTNRFSIEQRSKVAKKWQGVLEQFGFDKTKI